MSKYRYTITTLTPLHIGTGDAMTPLEYHIGQDLIVPDLELLFEKYPDAAARFSEQLAAKSAEDLARTGLDDLIAESVLDDPQVCRYAVPTFYFKPNKFDSLDRLESEIERGQRGVRPMSTMPEVRLAIKTAAHRPYIPGSSIKGALKTAWAYARCRQDQGVFNEIVRLAQTNDRKAAVAANQKLAARIFHAPIQPGDEQKRIERQRDAAYDVFRVVQINDSEPRPADEALVLAAGRVLSAGVKARADGAISNGPVSAAFKDYWTFCEAIDERQDFSGLLTFDERLFNDQQARRVMGWSDEQRTLTAETLCRKVNDFAADLCQWEIEYLERIQPDPRQCDLEDVLLFYQDVQQQIAAAPANTCYFSLGYGSGWHKLTIGLLLEKQLAPAQFAALRRNLQMADRHTDFEYPKSRKLMMNGERRAYSPFGWVKMVLTNE